MSLRLDTVALSQAINTLIEVMRNEQGASLYTSSDVQDLLRTVDKVMAALGDPNANPTSVLNQFLGLRGNDIETVMTVLQAQMAIGINESLSGAIQDVLDAMHDLLNTLVLTTNASDGKLTDIYNECLRVNRVPEVLVVEDDSVKPHVSMATHDSYMTLPQINFPATPNIIKQIVVVASAKADIVLELHCYYSDGALKEILTYTIEDTTPHWATYLTSSYHAEFVNLRLPVDVYYIGIELFSAGATLQNTGLLIEKFS